MKYYNGDKVGYKSMTGTVVRQIHYNIYIVWFPGEYESRIIEL
jgi:hypothetical protein